LNKIAKIAFLISGTGVLTIAPVFADNFASNDTTGAGSTNIASATSSLNCSIKQNNELTITNIISVTSSTGGNQANKNTGDGSVTTGDASGDVTVNNSGNSNDATLDCAVPPAGDASNTNTGADSINIATASAKEKQPVDQKNKATVGNNITRKARTGKNKANKNTGNGTVDTGSATGSANVTNGPLNTNTTGP
jgi:hypothetical protein